MPSFKEKLYKDASKYIIRVKIKDNVIPYTRIKSYNIVDSKSDECIALYNLITDKCDEVSFEDIISYTISNLNIVENIKIDTGFKDHCKKYYKICLEKNISEEVFYNLFLNKFIVDNNLQDTILEFNFQLDLDSITNNTLSEDSKESIKEAFINIVKNRCNESKNELNLIKKDCEDEDDIEDIDSIIEMFDDSVDSINLDEVKNLSDLLDNWPPLLLPLPDSLEKLKRLRFIVVNENDKFTKLNEMKSIIGCINDVNLLKEFKDILSSEKDTIDSKDFENYLKVINDAITELSNEKL